MGGVKKIWVQKARVPVLKFFGEGDEVLCDVSVNNTEGLLNSNLVRKFCETEPVLAPVLRLLKHWARSCKLGDRATGGFSSYTLVLMTIHVLQRTDTAVLTPQRVQTLCEETRSQSKLQSLGIWYPNTHCAEDEISRVLGDFFDFYSKPAFETGGVVHITPVDIGPQPDSVESLQVICPLSEIDVQRSHSQEWHRMFYEISKADQLFRRQESEALPFLFQSQVPPQPPPQPPPD